VCNGATEVVGGGVGIEASEHESDDVWRPDDDSISLLTSLPAAAAAAAAARSLRLHVR